MNLFFYNLLIIFVFLLPKFSYCGEVSSELKEQYQLQCQTTSDINEHVPFLRSLAKECETVVEIGVRSLVSTWGVLHGLVENPAEKCRYTGIDLNLPPEEQFTLARDLAKQHNISFGMIIEDDMNINIPKTDLLFIDSLHTYAHLTYELEKFCSSVNKYIAMHDTSAPWGSRDDAEYLGDRSEYPAFIDRSKRGLWLAVVDFLKRHPEWELLERRLNCHGFTVLKRKTP